MADVLTYGGSWLNFGGSLVVMPEEALPEYTVRVQFTDTSYTPTSATGGTSKPGGTWTAVDASQGIWDLYHNGADWSMMFNLSHAYIGANNYAKILGANIGSDVFTITSMFSNCNALTEVHNFKSSANLSNVTTSSVFNYCSYLTTADVDMSGASNLSSFFGSCANLSTVTIKTTNSLTNTTGMFSGCNSLVTAPNLVMDNVETATSMFNTCGSLTTVPSYNMSSCKNAYRMFNSCSSLTTVPTLNTVNLLYADDMFRLCSALTSVTIDLQKATTTYEMFYGCENLVTVNITGTQGVTGAATNTSYMFYECQKLTTINGFFNTSNVTTMACMFRNCQALTAVPNMNTGNVTSMLQMMQDCRALATVPSFNTSSVTTFKNFMSGCWNITSLPLFDMSTATNLEYAFSNCKNITAVPLFDTSSATSMNSMFYMCKKVESGALALYQQASTQSIPPSSHSNCFTQCGSDTTTGQQELAQIPTTWGGTLQS